MAPNLYLRTIGALSIVAAGVAAIIFIVPVYSVMDGLTPDPWWKSRGEDLILAAFVLGVIWLVLHALAASTRDSEPVVQDRE